MREKLTPQQVRARNILDKRVDATVRQYCSMLQIDIMDIRLVFQAAYVAAATGEDIDVAVTQAYCQLSEKCAPLQCATCGAPIDATQSALSRMRHHAAPAECKDCITASLTAARQEGGNRADA